jgi:hypothetical protein
MRGIFRPDAVLKMTTAIGGERKPSASRRFAATRVAAPSGHAKIPSPRAISTWAFAICASLTATATPPDSRIAWRMRTSANGAGTRRPAANVRAPSHGAAFGAPEANASTIGAHPSACTATMRGRFPPSMRPSCSISSNAFHIPTRPVPPPGRIDDRVRQRPAELLRDLVPQRLLPLAPVRLAERREIEPLRSLVVGPHRGPGHRDVPAHQVERSPARPPPRAASAPACRRGGTRPPRAPRAPRTPPPRSPRFPRRGARYASPRASGPS